MGVIVPSMFDMWVIATILVRGDSAASNSSSDRLPSSSQPTHFSTAPFRSRRKCQGTMLEWCSMMDRTISSPRPMWARPNEDATRFTASVAERVNTISSVDPALRKARTFSRAPSNASVAALAR